MTSELAATLPIADQPTAIVERDGVRYTLLGTAHVSKASVDAVRAAIASGAYDEVAVELDPQRLQGLTDPDALAKLDLVKVLREGKTAVFAANLALAGYQRRLAEKLGIEPGAELKVAAIEAQALGLPLHLIDRDVGLTFRRAMRRLGWWGRAKISAGLIAGMVGERGSRRSRDRKTQGRRHARVGLQRIRRADAGALRNDHRRTRSLHGRAPARIRDRRARRCSPSSAPATCRALRGICATTPNCRRVLREQLEFVPKKSSIPWFTLAITVLIVGSFAYGFWRGGFDVGADLILQWVLFTGGLGALGCLLAGGHPLSILTAFVAAPLKPFHPAFRRAPSAASSKRGSANRLTPTSWTCATTCSRSRGWYRNRVARVLVNFMLTNVGTAIGVWIAGAQDPGQAARLTRP